MQKHIYTVEKVGVDKGPCGNWSREDLRRCEESSCENAGMMQGRKDKHGDLDDELLVKEAHDYWKSRYMYHWLKTMGGNTEEAYHLFRECRGKGSYMLLGLELSKAIAEDEGSNGGSSHMSDMDVNGGLAGTRRCNHGCWSIGTTNRDYGSAVKSRDAA